MCLHFIERFLKSLFYTISPGGWSNFFVSRTVAFRQKFLMPHAQSILSCTITVFPPLERDLHVTDDIKNILSWSRRLLRHSQFQNEVLEVHILSSWMTCFVYLREMDETFPFPEMSIIAYFSSIAFHQRPTRKNDSKVQN